MINRKQMRILFVIYLIIILRVIVFKYPLEQLKEIVASWSNGVLWEGLHKANFTFFRTIQLYIKHWDLKEINSFANLIGNVLAFIPLGYILPRVCKAAKNFFVCMSIALLFITGIELFQLFSAFGIFDVDDILLNMIGALLGYLLYLPASLIWKQRIEASEHK